MYLRSISLQRCRSNYRTALLPPKQDRYIQGLSLRPLGPRPLRPSSNRFQHHYRLLPLPQIPH